ncbi:MAG: DNA replication and repair protein RecF [Dysgonamonadaceae bacterium]|jgi:DNA replication and repair protein RecF|nr:DNA replication and repair protein RecF [Dysgonamonadaceae bacterium]
MIIDKISILNFKNIEEAELSFSRKMNCFFGDNGMGKTNLLDALYYLSFTRNYTNLVDSQLIMHNREFAVIQGYYTDNETVEEIYCGIKHKQRKTFKRNKKEYERLSEHIGLIPLVMISPADIELIRGGSDERRKFADMLICQYDKEYMRALIHYNKALQQRNALLKINPLQATENEVFELWEEQMSASGQIIYEKRKAFVEGFRSLFQEYYRIISHENEKVDLTYESQLDSASLARLLHEKRDRDRILGYTSSGVHKDDFHFLLDEYLIRKIGSQGQNKTCLIALKLAQFSMLVQEGSSVPVLLLDDLFDKLDAKRVEQIIQLVSQPAFGQIFITDTNRKYLDEILAGMQHNYKLFYVEKGQIHETDRFATHR